MLESVTPIALTSSSFFLLRQVKTPTRPTLPRANGFEAAFWWPRWGNLLSVEVGLGRARCTARLRGSAVKRSKWREKAEILVTGIKVVDLLAPYAKGGKNALAPTDAVEDLWFLIMR